MPHPTVPDLRAFSATVRPNLMNGGPYDQQLTAIEEYLASLGDYVDAELARIESEIVSSSRGPACWVIQYH